jgi:mannose-6-phosphate isomerase-like protein (cupin superfamily)
VTSDVTREKATVPSRAEVIIERDLPVFKEIAGHFAPTPFLLTAQMLGGLGFEIAGGEISDKVGKPVAAPHTHPVPEIYLLLSPEPGQAVIDVYIDGEQHELSSPAALFIPAGTVHHFVTRQAAVGSVCLGILLTGEPSKPSWTASA